MEAILSMKPQQCKINPRSVIVIFVLILMFSSASVWARGAYKWVDDNGVVHYSDRMRTDSRQAEIINVRVNEPLADEAEGAAVSADQQDTADKPVQSPTAADAAAAKKQQKIRQANCITAHKQLSANESMTRMYRAGNNGKREYLSANERNEVIRRSLDAVKHWCD